MAVKSRKRKKQRKGGRSALAPLPESGAKFWQGAETNTFKIKSSSKCRHHFIRRSGREVECVNCHAGFVLNIGWRLKDGHIYYKNKKVL